MVGGIQKQWKLGGRPFPDHGRCKIDNLAMGTVSFRGVNACTRTVYTEATAVLAKLTKIKRRSGQAPTFPKTASPSHHVGTVPHLKGFSDTREKLEQFDEADANEKDAPQVEAELNYDTFLSMLENAPWTCQATCTSCQPYCA